MTEVRQSSAANAIGAGQGPKVSGLVGTGKYWTIFSYCVLCNSWLSVKRF